MSLLKCCINSLLVLLRALVSAVCTSPSVLRECLHRALTDWQMKWQSQPAWYLHHLDRRTPRREGSWINTNYSHPCYYTAYIGLHKRTQVHSQKPGGKEQDTRKDCTIHSVTEWTVRLCIALLVLEIFAKLLVELQDARQILKKQPLIPSILIFIYFSVFYIE